MKTITKILVVILGVFMIVGGIACLFSPVSTSLAIGYVVGLSMVFDAIGRFIEWWEMKKIGLADGWMLACAILSSIFGFFILNSSILQYSVDVFLAYYAACWLVILGIFIITRAFQLRKLHKNWGTVKLGTRWYLPLCCGILIAVFGILCLFKPIVMASVVGIFIGLGIIVSGANLITIATTPIDPMPIDPIEK